MRLLFVCVFFFSAAACWIPCHAAALSTIPQKANPRNSFAFVNPQRSALAMLTPTMFRQLTGRRMTWKERLAIKIYLRKERRRFAEGEPTEKQVRQGRLSLIFGAVALAIVFIPYVAVAAIPLAIAGLVLGIKSLKGNSNTMGILGLVFSALVLFIFLLAIAVVSLLLLTWGIR